MALADYRLCDVCEGKAFYDANLNYEMSTRTNPIPESEWIRGNSYIKLDDLGDWAVLCRDCAKTHECIIQAKNKGE